MTNTGCRIYLKVDRPDKQLIDSFKNVPVANLGDMVNRFFCVDARIKPYNKSHLVGPAFTVRARAGDNLFLHKALTLAQPGDIIVLDAQGDLTNAITGEIMMTEAQYKGIGGVIIDGAIRDAEEIAELTMPVYAAGVTPKGPYKDGPGEINVPICCGGVPVHPGDIVVGDGDGIIIINPKEAPELLNKVQAKMQKESESLRQIRAKEKRNKAWIDKTLDKLNCEIVDDYYKA